MIPLDIPNVIPERFYRESIGTRRLENSGSPIKAFGDDRGDMRKEI